MGVDPDASLRAFLDGLASRDPTPGGGSVAALAGALAAALTSMVFRLTVGKKGYEEVAERFEEFLRQSEALRERFLALAVEDAAAYEAVAQAFRMDRSTEDAKARRGATIQKALRGAAEVPQETARRCVDLLSLVETAAAKGNANALSDAGGAAHLAWAAFEGARLNVEINLSALKDEAFVDRLRTELEGLRGRVREGHRRATAAVASRLGIPP